VVNFSAKEKYGMWYNELDTKLAGNTARFEGNQMTLAPSSHKGKKDKSEKKAGIFSLTVSRIVGFWEGGKSIEKEKEDLKASVEKWKISTWKE